LDDLAIEAAYSGRPFLGVCVGMQLLFQGSEESPDVPGLGVLPGVVRRLPDGVKRPQMQWNVLRRTDGSEGGSKATKSGEGSKGRRESRLLAGMAEPSWVYFVHSYAAAPDEHTVATCDYPEPLSAAVERDALWATQFHPEKSSMAGLKILANFVRQADDAAKAA
jgi:glutamine amidotransferase